MTTPLDIRLIPKVLAIVSRLGKSITFETISGGTYDPLTRVYTGGSMTPIVKKVSPPYKFEDAVVNGDSIQAEDLQTDLPASGLSFTPKVGWTVLIDSVRYRILSVSPVYTGEAVALYHMQLRK